MKFVKFCNISKTTRLGIRPNDFITVTSRKANQMTEEFADQMGVNFVVLPEGQSPEPPKREPEHKAVKHDDFDKVKKWQKKS